MGSFLCSWAPVSILLAMGLQPENDSWAPALAGGSSPEPAPAPPRLGRAPGGVASASVCLRPPRSRRRTGGPGPARSFAGGWAGEEWALRAGARRASSAPLGLPGGGPGRPLSATAAAPAAFCVAGQAPGPHTASPGNAGALEPRSGGVRKEVSSPGRSSSGAAPSPGNQPSPPQEPAGPWTPQSAPSRCCRSSCSSARKESGFGGTGFVTVIRLEKAPRAGREGTGAPSELLLEAVARPGKVVTPAGRLQPPPQPSHLRHGAPGGNPSYDRTPAHRQGDSRVGTRRASRPLPSVTAPHKGKSEEQASASILPLSPVN
nr:translation initiation factor IF-2-like [Macaca fascicularis]